MDVLGVFTFNKYTFNRRKDSQWNTLQASHAFRMVHLRKKVRLPQ